MDVLNCHGNSSLRRKIGSGLHRVLAVLLLSIVVLGGCGGPGRAGKKAAGAAFAPADNPWTEGRDQSNRRLLVSSPYSAGEARNFAESFEAFSAATGIEVSFVPNAADGAAESDGLNLDDETAPDIVVFTRPDMAKRGLEQGQLVPLDRWFEPEYLRQQYHESLLDMVTFYERPAALWFRVNIRSLVWYSVPVFEREGYRIPESWEELERLTERMIADGYTPWSVGIESGEAVGWVAADWIEEIVLRSAGTGGYDDWISGELPFLSEEIRPAFRILDEIWRTPGQILGGTERILSTSFTEAVLPLIGPEPEALMHLQGDFLPAFFPDGTRIGGDVDCFYLPAGTGPSSHKSRRPLIITGECLGALNTEPETEALMRYFSRGISVEPWIKQGGCIAPHNDAQQEWYEGKIEARYNRIFRSADLYRFDASKLMPPQVGAGSFPEELTAFVEGKNLTAVLESIDRSWPR